MGSHALSLPLFASVIKQRNEAGNFVGIQFASRKQPVHCNRLQGNILAASDNSNTPRRVSEATCLPLGRKLHSQAASYAATFQPLGRIFSFTADEAGAASHARKAGADEGRPLFREFLQRCASIQTRRLLVFALLFLP